MRKMLHLLAAMLLLSGQLLAQTRTITGTVVDSKGTPLPGASVVVQGSKTGTTTQPDGSFSLTVPATARQLNISIVGFQSKVVVLNDQSTVYVTLATDDQRLDEVVVTAYGTTKRKSFTGTASTINADKFKDLQVSSITGVLQGQASGVLAVSANGQPGESPDIRIRGIGSVNASSAPLILLDGAPYGGNINGLNPSDIESITVLKDASSTALYGSRAANGVLQITTKSGRGTPKVSFSILNGWSSRAVKDYSYVNPQQVYELTWEALRNQANVTPGIIAAGGASSAEDYASKTVAGLLVYNPFGVAEPVGRDGKLVSNVKKLWNDNWSDALLRTGNRKDINLSVSGGSDKTRYYFSGGYLDDQGIAIESRFKRYTGRLKVDSKVNDWFTAGINTNLAYSTQNYPAQGGSSYSNVIGWIRNMSNIYPVYLHDTATGNFILNTKGNKQYDFGNNGQLTRPLQAGGNPVGTTALNPTTYDRFTSSVNGFGEAQIIKGLKFRTQYALDYFQIGQNTYYDPVVGDGAAYGGRGYRLRNNSSTQTFTNILTYDKAFADIHNINIVAGMEAYRFHESDVATEARKFTFPGATELDYGTVPYQASSQAYDSRLVSYFSRVNYDLNDKYHLSASLRRDGSSRFADSVRWGTFYSIGAAWNISRESFMNNVAFVSDLKLRASYGTTGNQQLPGYFPSLAAYSSGWNIADYSGSTISSLANGKLTWETQKTTDLGIDFGLFKNRITGSFTYFTRTSEKLLFLRPLAPSVFDGGVNDNIGSVRNRGIEIDVTSTNIRNSKLEWTTSINVTHVENKILSLPQEAITGSNFSNLIVGESLYNFYIREYAGVDATDGTPMWYIDQKDASGKITRGVTKTYSSATRYYKGTALPKWTGGLSNTVRYKGFDLSLLISFSIGGKIYDADYAGLNYQTTGNQPGANWSTDILGRWQSAANPGNGVIPKLMTTTDYQGNSSSTRFLYDASFTRVRNITLGYYIPKNVLNRAKISNARVFIDWQNPVTFFERKGLDPESGLAGVTSNTSSIYKTIAVGVNLDF